MSATSIQTNQRKYREEREGKTYDEIQIEYLERFLKMPFSEQKEEAKREEFWEAIRYIRSYHVYQREVIFGEDISKLVLDSGLNKFIN